MICKNRIKENNLERQCWLPVNPNSPFSLCNRCDYQKVEEILESEEAVVYLQKPEFCALVSQDSHHQKLFAFLARLCGDNDMKFPSLFQNLLKESIHPCINYQTLLSAQILTHTPCNRCKFYQYSLKHKKFERDISYVDMPWRCWNCLASVLRLIPSCYGWYRAFSNGLVRNQLHSPEGYLDAVIDCLVSLHLSKKDHAVRLLFDRTRQGLKDEGQAKAFLIRFLSEPCMIKSLFDKTALDFIPLVWQKKGFLQEFQRKALQNVRARNWVFKEELMIKTWEPERLFSWCFDLEDLADFGN